MTPSIEEFAAAATDMQVEMVPIDTIQFDQENPNELAPALYETLKQEIQTVGFSQPVLLWKREDGYRMIDGEHRTRIVQELGGTHIPAIVTDAASEDEAQFRLLTMNRLRGQMMPIRFALLVSKLVEHTSEDEVRRRLGMEDAEIRDSLKLADFTDDVGDALRAAVDRERTTAPQQLRFVVSARDGDLIERVVAAVAADGNKDRGKALAEVCRNYEQHHKSKEKPDGN